MTLMMSACYAVTADAKAWSDLLWSLKERPIHTRSRILHSGGKWAALRRSATV
jgi:hypothetical protein